MTSITPNNLHNTKFKNISNYYFKDIWDYYCDDGLGCEYILEKDKHTKNKIDGHYLAMSNTGDYIYVKKIVITIKTICYCLKTCVKKLSPG